MRNHKPAILLGLRDYGIKGQLGLEKSPEMFVQKLMEVFREVKRTLKDDGTFWLNLGDSYWGSHSMGTCSPDAMGLQKHISPENYGSAMKRSWPKESGIKPKDLIGIPWAVAFALRADGWYLRSDIIWSKSNPMPESIKDRPTRSHEYVFLLAKNQKYYFDNEAVREKSKGEWNSAKGFNTEGQRKRQGSIQNYGKDKIQNGRNKRSVFLADDEYMTLKKDLTFATKQSIIEEIIKRELL